MRLLHAGLREAADFHQGMHCCFACRSPLKTSQHACIADSNLPQINRDVTVPMLALTMSAFYLTNVLLYLTSVAS